jgi:hypothetical protein
MKTCKVYLEGLPGSPYSQSAMHDTPKLDRESAEDYDIRTWRNHCTVNGDGQVCVPAMAFKQCLDTCAQKLGIKIPGRRGATFKSFFLSGFFCNADAPLLDATAPLTAEKADLLMFTMEKAEMIAIWANADGVRGSGKRVKRRYPMFYRWRCTAELTIVDDIITTEMFEHHFRSAGMIVGIGRYRPEKGGNNGRFRVVRFEWTELTI